MLREERVLFREYQLYLIPQHNLSRRREIRLARLIFPFREGSLVMLVQRSFDSKLVNKGQLLLLSLY